MMNVGGCLRKSFPCSNTDAFHLKIILCFLPSLAA